MNLSFTLRNEMQRTYLALDGRNICISGGFNNGKSYIACLKYALRLMIFPKYRVLIGRQYYSDLRKTTMKTMMKIIPEDFILTHDETSGVTTLRNGSTILWMHLDSFDEQSLRGLEINSAFLDQAEEIDPAIFLILDSRIGRWDLAEVPKDLAPNWPLNKWGKPLMNNSFDIAVNPDSMQHWVYRMFHPDSIERNPSYQYVEAPTDVDLGDPETMKQMQGRDPEWVDQYFLGKWGASQAQIHYIRKDSKILVTDALLDEIKRKASISLVLDHGDTSPTAAILMASMNGVHIIFKEYYVPNRVISYHRSELVAMMAPFEIQRKIADPSIFNKTMQKNGEFYSVAQEYASSDIPGPPIYFLPADHNEMATRNRINEFLLLRDGIKHPITGESPAPQLYFALPNRENGTGAPISIAQTEMQQKKLLATDNGKKIYSDERDHKIVDHAYDVVRYSVASHGSERSIPRRKPAHRSFDYFAAVDAARKQRGAVSAFTGAQ